jgi:hypothetical protein
MCKISQEDGDQLPFGRPAHFCVGASRGSDCGRNMFPTRLLKEALQISLQGIMTVIGTHLFEPTAE